jgi:hypothetical protein
MSDEGSSELLRLYVLLKATTDARARVAIREQIDSMLDRAEGYVPPNRGNGHDRSPHN